MIETIRALREQRGMSQHEIAGKIGISRSSYIAFEQGKKELSLTEARKLAGTLGIPFQAFEQEQIPDDEKYKQMLYLFLRSSVSSDGQIPKTKLAKLLYLADFAWFYKHLKSMSGMEYRKIPYGPVPDTYFRIVEELYDEGKLNINMTKEGAMLISETDSGKREKTNLLSSEEKKLIKSIAKKWKGKRTQEIVSFTHNQLPYAISDEKEIIPYELITQEDPEYVY